MFFVCLPLARSFSALFALHDHQVSLPFCTVLESGDSDCGSNYYMFYFVSFYVVVVFVFLNLFVAVILENFNSAYTREDNLITNASFENFQMVFDKYDTENIGAFPIAKLKNFLNVRV